MKPSSPVDKKVERNPDGSATIYWMPHKGAGWHHIVVRKGQTFQDANGVSYRVITDAFKGGAYSTPDEQEWYLWGFNVDGPVKKGFTNMLTFMRYGIAKFTGFERGKENLGRLEAILKGIDG